MRRAFCLLVISFLLSAVPSAIAQQRYTLDVRQAHVDVRRGHLRMGGSNPRGDTIGANSFYLEYNGRPWFPLVGEFHYVRYPSASWDEELRKMKAGGIQVVATYVFWIIHEETEGHFDWTGNRNLRHFLELVAKNGLWAIVRVGPFIHAEIRNGGLPDWLYGRPFRVRSNDPEYLAYVARYYREVARQLEGLYFKDGGPIIAIQLENEYEHSAALGLLVSGPAARMDRLGFRSRRAGFGAHASAETTGPGGRHGRTALHGHDGATPPSLRWRRCPSTRPTPIPPGRRFSSPLYLFRNLQQTPDYAPVSYDPSLYPVLGAELFGGIQVTYTRRPTIPPRSLEAQIVRQLGSGANGIGYYMYHGGATPRGRFFYFSDEAIGVPRINYDFQAPIGQYGQLRPSFHYLKLLHFFLQDYGTRLPRWPSSCPKRPHSCVRRPPTRCAMRPARMAPAAFSSCTTFRITSPCTI
ncbi:beta-galactosidase [Rhodothermus marinus]|uniref:beta-galactosidase n=1 Tax=Rhodothermus marinus TaxID=29549 RepID=UPI000AF6DDDE|nr:beta-galactosidase [Rhodothermus marinus]